MIDFIFGPWIEPCRSIGCTWTEEQDADERGTWLWHRGPDEPEINPEHRMFISAEMQRDWGKARQMAMGFFAAHHRNPMPVDFDEERERARLVAV